MTGSDYHKNVSKPWRAVPLSAALLDDASAVLADRLEAEGVETRYKTSTSVEEARRQCDRLIGLMKSYVMGDADPNQQELNL